MFYKINAIFYSLNWYHDPRQIPTPINLFRTSIKEELLFFWNISKTFLLDDSLLGSFYLKTYFYNIHIQSSARETGQEKVHILEAKVTL